MDEQCITFGGRTFCFRIYYAIRKFPWDDGDPWLDLHQHFDDLGDPPFRFDEETPVFYNDLVRLKAATDIVRTVRNESVRESLTHHLEKMSVEVMDAASPAATAS